MKISNILSLTAASLLVVGFTSAALAAPPAGKGKKERDLILADLVEVDCGTGDALSGSTHGTIDIGSDAASCYIYEIAISGASAGDVYVDSVGSVWDLAPELDLVDDADNDPGDSWEKTGDCDVTLTQPASAFKTENVPEQQPENITIVMNSDANCTVEIFIKTAGIKNSLMADACSDPSFVTQATCENESETWTPAHFAAFHPASCSYLFEDAPEQNGKVELSEILLDDEGVPMANWFAVNDGAKGYDASDDGVLKSDRLMSFQLKPLACDADGDLATDVCEVAEGSDPLDAGDAHANCLP